ncbi:MAG: penicillin-binding protein 2 [Bradymonadales bacterium]|nr:MAG: penicillin-binding protein 2 [Bradymonadales bacterium]
MRLSDPYNTTELKSRAQFVAIGFAFLIFLLLFRLWYLQIWRGEEYRLFSDRNRFKIERISAPRGQILDRRGALLADNRPRFDIHVTRAFATNLDKELEALKSILQWSDEEFEERSRLVKAFPLYQSRRIARDVSWDQLAQVENRSNELSSLGIQVQSVRDYLYGDAFFHVIGYTGEVSEINLQRLRQRFPDRNYRLGDSIGVIGAESIYERFLRGSDGREFVVVDVKGRPVHRTNLRLFDQNTRVGARAGNSLELSLDLELQLTALRAFGDQRGAAVALDPNTGEILAMISRPSLDPNLFTRELTGRQLNALRERPDKPFLDRSLGEHYPPGSTYKMLMGAAALEEGVVTAEQSFHCPGFFRFGRRIWRCHRRSGHGHVDLREAIKVSCDVYFYNVALALGLDRMHRWAKQFGLGRRTNLGHEIFSNSPLAQFYRFNSEQTGFVPNSSWVRRSGHTSLEGETINAGIGQGGNLMTVTQLARMTAAFGNSGQFFQPQLVRAQRRPGGDLIEAYESLLENQVQLKPETSALILDAMKAVVNERDGTALGSRIAEFSWGGKTGTSQVVALSLRPEDEDEIPFEMEHHALFVGLAPIENPKIAVAVIVEHGRSGSRAAAPIARAMVRNYLNRQVAAR